MRTRFAALLTSLALMFGVGVVAAPAAPAASAVKYTEWKCSKYVGGKYTAVYSTNSWYVQSVLRPQGWNCTIWYSW